MIYSKKKLGEICDVIGGGTPKTGVARYWQGDIVWITPKDLGQLGGDVIIDSNKKISSDGLKESSARLLPKGTVVLSSRAPIGYVSIASVPLATNQGCKSFICDEKYIHNKFLYYFLVAKREYLNQIGGGSTFKEVSGSKLKEVEIPLPPIAEQRRIVARVEKLLAKVGEAKRLRAEARAATKSLLSAELHKIFEEGKKKGWDEKELSEICEISRGGSPRPIKDYLTDDEHGINWVKIGDATGFGKYIYSTREKIKREGLKKTRLVAPDDLLLTNSMSFGHPYIMKTSGAIHDGWLLLRPSKIIWSEYLYYFLSSDAMYKQFSRLAGGAVVQNLNSKLVAGVNILIPPLTEQKKIVARLDKLSAKLKKLEEYQKSADLDLARLEQSILHQAFSEVAVAT